MPPSEDQCLQEVLICSRQKVAFNIAGGLGATSVIEPSSPSTTPTVGYFAVKRVRQPNKQPYYGATNASNFVSISGSFQKFFL